MAQDDLLTWFDDLRSVLEAAYLRAEKPWQGSGFGLHTPRTCQDWEALRRPIADCVDRSGSFLDIGCANGYLLECVLAWTGARGIVIDPYGLDLSPIFVELARRRLPQYADHLFVGNAWDWDPPRSFDYVRTELVYVPEEIKPAFVSRIIERYLSPGGRLLVAHYQSTREPEPEVLVDRYLTELGFRVESVRTGYLAGKELTRIAVIGL